MEPNGTDEPGSFLGHDLDAAAQLAAEAEGHAGAKKGKGTGNGLALGNGISNCDFIHSKSIVASDVEIRNIRAWPIYYSGIAAVGSSGRIEKLSFNHLVECVKCD